MEARAGSGCTSWRPSRARANVARYGPQQVRLPSFFCVKFMTTASRPRPATGAFTYIASEAGRLGSVGVLLLGVALGTASAFGGPLGWYTRVASAAANAMSASDAQACLLLA